VIELRFHEEFYDGFAIDEAVKAFSDHATAELSRDGRAYVVRVTAKPDAGADERTISAELSNFALGLTVEKARAGGAA